MQVEALIGEEMKLAEIRKKSGVSQVELAKHVGKSDRTIQAWEADKASPPADVVWDICEFLGCDPNTLLGWYDEHPEDMPKGARDSEEQALLDNYRACSGKNRALITLAAQVACASPDGQEVGIALSESA